MGDILKEAIADAKAVRETALENAKMALEEAFTPQLKSMLSAKLKEDEMDNEEEPEETYEDDEVGEEEPEEGYHEDDEEGEDEPEEVHHEDDMGDDEEVPAEDHDFDDEEGENKLDLEAIIRELEAELSEGEDEDEDEVEESTETSDETVSEGADEDDDKVDESTDETVEEEYEIDENALTEEDDDDDDKDEVDEELDKTSGIGSGTGRGDTDKSSGIGKGSSTEVYKESVQKELNEYKEAVKFLKNKLHEVNILNAKLLFTNKLFKAYSLDNNQKLKVVETFDRAQTTREIKLVYSTLAEQFNDNGSIVTRKSIKESASSAVGSTKPSKESRKVISEETQVANRFKKLAGLVK